MIYTPKRKDAVFLLKKSGFVPARLSIGHEKVEGVESIREGKFDRLHATAHHGFINLHFDVETKDHKHKGRATRQW